MARVSIIKAGCHVPKDNSALFILGLTDEAVVKLKGKEPVLIDIASLIAALPPGTDLTKARVALLYEPTAADFMERFATKLDPATIMRVTRGAL